MSWVPAPISIARIVSALSVVPSGLATVVGIARARLITGRKRELVEKHICRTLDRLLVGTCQLVEQPRLERAGDLRLVAGWSIQIGKQAGLESRGGVRSRRFPSRRRRRFPACRRDVRFRLRDRTRRRIPG